MSGTYFLLLMISIIFLVLVDFRYKLAFWSDPIRTILTIGTAILFFLAWDLNGIFSGVFFKGGSSLLLGVDVLKEVPVEELFFLTLLSYCALLLYCFSQRRKN